MRKGHIIGVSICILGLALAATPGLAAVARTNDRSYQSAKAAVVIDGHLMMIQANTLSGGDIMSTGSGTAWSPFEFDLSLSEVASAAPLFDAIIGGTLPQNLQLAGFNYDNAPAWARTVQVGGMTLTFPACAPAGTNPALVHVTLTPARVTDAAPGNITLKPQEGLKPIPASNCRIDAGKADDTRYEWFSAPMTINAAGTAVQVTADTDRKGALTRWGRQQLEAGVTDAREGAATTTLRLTYLPPNLKPEGAVTLSFATAWPVRAATIGAQPRLDLMAKDAHLGYGGAPQEADTPAGAAGTQLQAADSGKPVDPSAVRAPSKDAVVGQTYYADEDRRLAITLTGLRYEAGRYAYDGAELVPDEGEKLLVATFDLTNLTDEDQHLPYAFRASTRDAKGGQHDSDGVFRAGDRSQDDIVIAPGETTTFEAASLMAGAWQAQQLKLGGGSGENVYSLKTAAIDPLPATISPDGVAFPAKVPADLGQWYPVGVLDARLDAVETNGHARIDGQGVSDGYTLLLTRWTMRNATRRDQGMPYAATVTVYDANGASWRSESALDDNLNTLQPGFAPEGQDGSAHTVRFAVQIPTETKIARIEYSESGSHAFVYRP